MPYNSALKGAIEDANFYQGTVAARVGVSEGLLSMILKGDVVPTAKIRAKLAALLGKPERELFPED